jgi:hypothetical protein
MLFPILDFIKVKRLINFEFLTLIILSKYLIAIVALSAFIKRSDVYKMEKFENKHSPSAAGSSNSLQSCIDSEMLRVKTLILDKISPG